MSNFKQTFTVLMALLALFIIQFNTASAAFANETKLKANYIVEYEFFGTSVALSEQRIIVGAPEADGFTDNSGKIYTYEPDGSGGWIENTLVGRDLEPGDYYGFAVAAAEDTIIVGAPFANANAGTIFIYEADGAGWWTEAEISLHAPNEQFGFSLAMTDEHFIVGAPYDDQTGSITILNRGQDWQLGYEARFLQPADLAPGARFGHSVAAEGNRIVVGAPSDIVDGRQIGSVTLLEWDETVGWTETKFSPSDQQASQGSPSFGDSVALGEDRIVVGAPFAETSQGWPGGATYVYEPDGAGGWTETKLSASDGLSVSIFGEAVATAGDRIFVGAEQGVHVYEPDGAGGWTETKLSASEGWAVAADGDRIAVGAPGDSEGEPFSGAVYLYDVVTDVDQDGVLDEVDNCPTVANADQADFDGDGLGDACDIDDDNDGFNDATDAFPFDPSEWLDTDGDTIGNNADVDDDNDGQLDHHEIACGSDSLNSASLSPDFDGDNVPDCVDPDIDNDGFANENDAFPYDPTEWNDNDGDGIGDNADLDDDNDGQLDADEIACGSDPLDPTSLSPDFDGDSIPDCVDPDDDNDSVLDEDDLCAETSMTDDAPPQPRKNRYFVIANGEFVDGEGSSSGYTIADTGGCASKQIIEIQQPGNGHSKYGLSRSELEAWIASIP